MLVQDMNTDIIENNRKRKSSPCSEPGPEMVGNPGSYHVETAGSSTIITYPGGTVNRVFELAPGVLFSFNHVMAESLPAWNTDSYESFITINHARSGVCEMQTDEGNYIYVKGGDICISREIPDRQFRFPTGQYEGIEICIIKENASDTGILPYLNIDTGAIASNYLDERHGTFISHFPDILEEPLKDLYAMAESDTPDVPLLRIYGLMIMRMLTAAMPALKPSVISALTPGQLDMAGKAQQILTEHLEQRIPLRTIAQTMDVSESSLRNYFRAVYGMNVSDYLFEARMKKGQELLTGTDLPVGEIAHRVGYSSQSRFDAAFRRYTGCAPMEYRRGGGGLLTADQIYGCPRA